MAESKGSFQNVFSKKVKRTKEKVLQNLGKADKTTDTEFDEHVQNFNKQQAAATRLQKELKNYITCVRAMSTASRTFYDVLKEIYETEWSGYPDVVSAVEQLSFLWEDYLLKLNDQVHNPIANYMARFPDVRAKIAKRGRKLTDFDSQRHAFDAQLNAKKRDEAKIHKAKEDLDDARKIYTELNKQMNEELPMLYDSRIGFMASNFNSLFNTEAKFQEESAKIKTVLADATDRLSKENNVNPVLTAKYKPFTNGNEPESESASYNILSSTSRSNRSSGNESASPAPSPREQRKELVSPANGHPENHLPAGGQDEATYEVVGGEKAASGEESDYSAPPSPKKVVNPVENRTSFDAMHAGFTPAKQTGGMYDGDDDDGSSLSGNSALAESPPRLLHPEKQKRQSDGTQQKVESARNEEDRRETENISKSMDSMKKDSESNNSELNNQAKVNNNAPKPQNRQYSAEDEPGGDIYNVPTSNEPINSRIPTDAQVLYMVKATHPYEGEDTDELTFEAGEVIAVVPFDDPDEQDEGWLMGIKESTGVKGVFPANFTRQI